MDTTVPGNIQLMLTGRKTGPHLPAVFSSAARSAGAGEDIFLPPDYLTPIDSFDVGPAARGSAAGAALHSADASASEVIVLELADGGTLVTSGGRLREALRRAHPELLEGDTILLEKLRADSAAPNRGLGAVVGGVISKVFLLAAGKAPDAILDAALGRLVNKAEHVAGVAALWAQQLSERGMLNAFDLIGKLAGSATSKGLKEGFDPFDVGAGLVQCPQAQ